MKGDNSRDTFLREKHYRTLRMQQGRVQLDADWNELADIEENLITGLGNDIVGSAAVGLPAIPLGPPPAPGQGGFAISIAAGGANIQITSGRYYVDGVLAELEPPATGTTHLFTAQPDLPLGSPPNPAFLPQSNTTQLVYLDVWQRHVTSVEDPSIRELAIGGPDTATRTRTVAQVKLLAAPGAACGTAVPAFDQLVRPATPGQMSAQAVGPTSAASPCDIGTGGGFTGLQNQLYRVEIHHGGNVPGTVTYKWSRDNGSILFAQSPAATPPSMLNPLIVLQTAPPDDAHGFSVGQWVELLDDKIELQGRSGVMVKLTNVDGVNLTFDINNVFNPDGTKVPLGTPPSGTPLGGIDLTAHAKVRRWDQSAGVTTGSSPVPASNAFVDLENGVQVRFLSPGTYRSGDFWLIPARTAIGSVSGVEWPTDLVGVPPAPVPRLVAPRGIVHRYARLAMVDFNVGGTFSNLQDCRRRLPLLSTLSSDDVAFTSIPVTLPLPPLPAPQTVTAALQVLGNRTAPPAKVRQAVTSTTAAPPISNNSNTATFSLLSGMNMLNLALSNTDSSGRVPVIVRFYMGGINATRTGSATNVVAEFQLVLVPAATGTPQIIAFTQELFIASPAGLFESRGVYMERLLAGATNGLVAGTYSFSVNWSVRSPDFPPATGAISLTGSVGGSTRELMVMEL
jgi:hypothetical protein